MQLDKFFCLVDQLPHQWMSPPYNALKLKSLEFLMMSTSRHATVQMGSSRKFNMRSDNHL